MAAAECKALRTSNVANCAKNLTSPFPGGPKLSEAGGGPYTCVVDDVQNAPAAGVDEMLTQIDLAIADEHALLWAYLPELPETQRGLVVSLMRRSYARGMADAAHTHLAACNRALGRSASPAAE